MPITLNTDKLIISATIGPTRVNGISFSKNPDLAELPDGIEFENLGVVISGTKITRIPKGNYSGIDASNTPLREIDPQARIGTLVAENCELEAIPEGVIEKYGRVFVKSNNLRELPKGLEIDTLRIAGCRNLTKIPEDIIIDGLSLEDFSVADTAIDDIKKIPKSIRNDLDESELAKLTSECEANAARIRGEQLTALQDAEQVAGHKKAIPSDLGTLRAAIASRPSPAEIAATGIVDGRGGKILG